MDYFEILEHLLDRREFGFIPTMQRRTPAAPQQRGMPPQAPFPVSMQQHQRSGNDISTLNWWRRKLDGAPQLLEVPLDRPRASTQAIGRSVSVPIDSELRTNIAALCSQERVSEVSILVAAWAACPSAGRRRPRQMSVVRMRRV